MRLVQLKAELAACTDLDEPPELLALRRQRYSELLKCVSMFPWQTKPDRPAGQNSQTYEAAHTEEELHSLMVSRWVLLHCLDCYMIDTR